MTGAGTAVSEVGRESGLFHVPYPDATPARGSHSPGFGRPEWVDLAASLVDSPPWVTDGSHDGALVRYRLVLGAGMVRIATAGAPYEKPGGAGGGSGRGAVTGWSRRSRLRMVETMCSLDWRPVVASDRAGWRPVMVTLTLPADWLAVAPTGAEFKKAFERFRARWTRRYGTPSWVWKLEFQGRGAPHLHLYTAWPVGLEHWAPGGGGWLSRAWCEAVNGVKLAAVPDESNTAPGVLAHLRAGTGVDWGEGIRASDPKRLGIYFLKRATGHNLGASKEYQHLVPHAWGGVDPETGERGPDRVAGPWRNDAERRRLSTGPGRFWGYYGLSKATAEVELDEVQFVRFRRLLRRWAKANGVTSVARSVARRQGVMVLANDAPGLVAQATRWAQLSAGDGPVARERAPLVRAG